MIHPNGDKKTSIISRNVWLLALISLFTDVASEMLYPILPLYLDQIGFSIVFIGVLEGVAEAIAGISKGYFGQLSDIKQRRKPFIQLGYTLSSIAKPMIALFMFPTWIFGSRTMDRIGKGIRTGARDALLSEEAKEGAKARIFGFHRSMDTLGAALGPLFAILYLHYFPTAYRVLFFLAFFPGIISICFTFLIKESKQSTTLPKKRIHFLSFLGYIKSSPKAYQKLLRGLLFFALINSSNVFLLLMFKAQGIDDTRLLFLYVFYNLVFAGFALPAGKWADKIGLKRIFIVGLGCFMFVYAGMAVSTTLWSFLVLFFIYGVFDACTNGVSKAWICSVVPKENLATAIGTYEALHSVCMLLSSSLAGLVWFQYSPEVLFLVTAGLAVLVIIYFFFIPDIPPRVK